MPAKHNTELLEQLLPSSRQNSSTSLSLPRQNVYQQQYSNEGGFGRMMSWPRNCLRFVSYVTIAILVTILFGFFVETHHEDRPIYASGREFETPISHIYRGKPLFPKPQLKKLIDTKRIPNVAHFIWCHNENFTFQHFTSVQSVIKFIGPDLVIVHLTNEPEIDPFGYNDWWNRLKTETQNLVIDRFSTENCTESMEREMFQNITSIHGGIFISNGVILSSGIDLNIETNSVLFEFPDEDEVKHEDYPALALYRPDGNSAGQSSLKRCVTSDDYEHHEATCVIYDKEEPLYPRDCWDQDGKFARLVRAVAYNTDAKLIPQSNPDKLVPKIVHYLFLGGGTVDFLFYLSILSSLHILK